MNIRGRCTDLRLDISSNMPRVSSLACNRNIELHYMRLRVRMPRNIGVVGDVRRHVLSSKCATPSSESTERVFFFKKLAAGTLVWSDNNGECIGPERAGPVDITQVAEMNNRWRACHCVCHRSWNWQRETASELNAKSVAATVFVTTDGLGQSKCGPYNITRQLKFNLWLSIQWSVMIQRP